MALMTLRGIKRHPVAVLTVEAERGKVDRVTGQADFEWFNTPEAAQEWLKTWLDFCEKDTNDFNLIDSKDDPVMAYLTIVIEDTASMDITATHLFPDNEATQAWRDEITADLSQLYEKREEEKTTTKKAAVVKKRPRRIGLGSTTPSDAD